MDNVWIIYGYGWWLGHPSEKYEFVNWDDELPNMWKNKIHVPLETKMRKDKLVNHFGKLVFWKMLC